MPQCKVELYELDASSSRKTNVFRSIEPALRQLVDKISASAAKGQKEGFSEYSTVWREAGKIVSSTTSKLTNEEVEWIWRSLKLTSPLNKHRDDIAQNIVGAWDFAASAAVGKKTTEVSTNLEKLSCKLFEFDVLVEVKGVIPPPKPAAT